MAWATLVIAGLCEAVWALSLKATEGFTRVVPSIVSVTAMIFSFVFLSLSLRTIPASTAYVVWTGVGIAGTVVVGVLLLNEPMEAPRLAFTAMIVVGILGLYLVTP